MHNIWQCRWGFRICIVNWQLYGRTQQTPTVGVGFPHLYCKYWEHKWMHRILPFLGLTQAFPIFDKWMPNHKNKNATANGPYCSLKKSQKQSSTQAIPQESDTFKIALWEIFRFSGPGLCGIVVIVVSCLLML